MRQVSESVEAIFMKLVAWEMLGAEDMDPKLLLRQVPLADLSVVQKNINGDKRLKQFVSVQMIELEMLYRTGLQGDWGYERNGEHVHITYLPLLASMVETSSVVMGVGTYPIGANA